MVIECSVREMQRKVGPCYYSETDSQIRRVLIVRKIESSIGQIMISKGQGGGGKGQIHSSPSQTRYLSHADDLLARLAAQVRRVRALGRVERHFSEFKLII